MASPARPLTTVTYLPNLRATEITAKLFSSDEKHLAVGRELSFQRYFETG